MHKTIILSNINYPLRVCFVEGKSIGRKSKTSLQINEMKNKILQVTCNLFETKKINDITIIDIAKKSGIAKGTVFLYFKTKEEIFLLLTEKKFDELCGDFENDFKGFTIVNNNLDLFFKRFEKILDRHKNLFRLLAILHITIEDNVDYNTIYQFKFNMHSKLIKMSKLFETIFPFLKNRGFLFLQWFYTLIIGFEHITNPSRIARQVIENEKIFNIYKRDFKKDLISVMKILIIGLKNDI